MANTHKRFALSFTKDWIFVIDLVEEMTLARFEDVTEASRICDALNDCKHAVQAY